MICHPEAGAVCPPKDLGEPRVASRSLRRNNRAFGSLPYTAAKKDEDADAALERWIGRAAEALSIGLATVENLFDPEIVILGGAAPGSLLDRLHQKLEELRASVRQDLGRERLRLSMLGERSAALGASALPILAATSAGPVAAPKPRSG